MSKRKIENPINSLYGTELKSLGFHRRLGSIEETSETEVDEFYLQVKCLHAYLSIPTCEVFGPS